MDGAEVDETLGIAVSNGSEDAVGEFEVAVGDPHGGGADEAGEIILGGGGFQVLFVGGLLEVVEGEGFAGFVGEADVLPVEEVLGGVEAGVIDVVLTESEVEGFSGLVDDGAGDWGNG